MADEARTPSGRPGDGIDTTVPHSARIWNYWLGGKDNYPVDRAAGDEYKKLAPQIVEMALYDRYFLGRAVRYLAGEVGIRQFLDVGTGLPTADNTHEVAQRVAPDARIVYVDNDPLVLAHARALLTSTPEGVTHYIDADMREPDRILEQAAKVLDFEQPIALMLIGVLGHIDPYEKAVEIIRHLFGALPPGSHLAITEAGDDNEAVNRAQEGYNNSGAVPYHLRTHEQMVGYFEGLELVEPGLVRAPLWRPDPSPFEPDLTIPAWGAVARKP